MSLADKIKIAYEIMKSVTGTCNSVAYCLVPVNGKNCWCKVPSDVIVKLDEMHILKSVNCDKCGHPMDRHCD